MRWTLVLWSAVIVMLSILWSLVLRGWLAVSPARDLSLSVAFLAFTAQLTMIEAGRDRALLTIGFDSFPPAATHRGGPNVSVDFWVMNSGARDTALASVQLTTPGEAREPNVIFKDGENREYGAGNLVIPAGHMIRFHAVFDMNLARWPDGTSRQLRLRVKPVIGRRQNVQVPAFWGDRIPWGGPSVEFRGYEPIPIDDAGRL